MHTIRMPTSRWQAFLIHLGFSAVLYIVLLYLIVFHWYPQPYFAADGGWEGVQIITGVDLVLGPVLTLLVYRAGKRGLKFDLTLIATLQIAALIWGTWLVYGQRTAAVVFASARFSTLSAEQVVDAGERAMQLVAESTTRPPYLMVPIPADKKEYTKLIGQAMASGIPLAMRGELFQPINADNRKQILDAGIDIERRVEGLADDREKLDEFLAKHGGRAEDYAFVPLSCRYRFLLLALNRKDASVVDALDIRPARRFAPEPENKDKPESSKP